jgi:GT2 family glycosyltransferase
MLCRNNLELTKRAVSSVLSQDVPVFLQVVDNDSGFETASWLASMRYPTTEWLSLRRFSPQLGVSAGWNWGLRKFFDPVKPGSKWHLSDHCLVVNNDVVLPSWFYRSLLAFDLPFVTGVSVDSMDGMQAPKSDFAPPREAPDFSAFLIRRDCWQHLGPFDERMVHYASDNAYHVEAHRRGLALMNGAVPFYHERSSTIRGATPEERDRIQAQANADREVFRSLYGCVPWESAYQELFK